MMAALAPRALAAGWPSERLIASHHRAERRAEIAARRGLTPAPTARCGFGADRRQRLAAPALTAATQLPAGNGTPPDVLAAASTKGRLTGRALRVIGEARFRPAVSVAVEAMRTRAAELRDAPG